jgi:hypothetical protein
MSPEAEYHPQWLDHYMIPHTWTLTNSPPTPTSPSTRTFTRALGLVESSFDLDGTELGGRADMNALLSLSLSHTLSSSALRRRIALAWTCLSLQHVLLRSYVCENDLGTREFAVRVPADVDEAVREVERGIVWVEDVYGEVDEKEMYEHVMNVGRVIDPDVCLSKQFVLPLTRQPNGMWELRLLVVMAHEISDGLSAFGWFGNLVRILNLSEARIKGKIEDALDLEKVRRRLPLAQEDLYPRVAGNKARQRWFWAILRVLRHVKKTAPPSFDNPLFRETRPQDARAFPPTFDRIFDYSAERRPPMNTGHVSASLSQTATARLVSLCRASHISIGAGCFALAGLAMMELHEARYPDIPTSQREAMTASFPLNPRAFFTKPPPADSCMLAFSEGVVMPFLPSSLPIEGRLKLVAKHANRELRVYQKRLKSGTTAAGLDKHAPGRLLAAGYLAQIERVEGQTPEHRKLGLDPQGGLPAAAGKWATCGVSSLGPIAAFFQKDVDDLANMEGKDFAADFRNITMGVRARDNEFLVGSRTDVDGLISFGVSYDANAISKHDADRWAIKISELLEKSERPRL